MDTLAHESREVHTHTLPRRSAGHVRLEWIADPHGPGAGTLTIYQRRRVDTYAVVEIPTDWDGRAVRLEKVEANPEAEREYYFCFAHRGGQDHQCDCRGFAAHSYCKHLDALIALLESGSLDTASELPEEADGCPF